ncbi:MAG TPA: DUF3090 family protein [Candidatus Dormibacteraeota bacterium]|jgi:uncharacterized repeat protein (TIGR03847 family)
MASESFDYERVARVTAGAVGEPGKRTFFLQLQSGGAIVSLAIEKDQLRVLAARLEEVFATVSLPAAGPMPDMALQEPVRPAWRVGLMTLAYDEARNDFEVSLVELVDEGAEPATGHFLATVGQMQALAQHTTELIAAGRPPCPMCGGPIDHDGGMCPRLNGHH